MAAEQVLASAVRFHDSAKQRGQRKGDDWEPMENELKKLLLDVRIEQLNDLADAKDWDQAFALTRRLAASYTSPKEQALIARPLADLLKKALQSPGFRDEAQMRTARDQLRSFMEQFPGNQMITPIQRQPAAARPRRCSTRRSNWAATPRRSRRRWTISSRRKRPGRNCRASHLPPRAGPVAPGPPRGGPRAAQVPVAGPRLHRYRAAGRGAAF